MKNSKDKIAVVLPRFPYPLEKGDKLRAYHQIRILSKEFDVILYALTKDKVPQEHLHELEKYCTECHVYRMNSFLILWNTFKQFFTRKPFQVGYFYQKSIAIKIKKSISITKPVHIYCQLVRSSEYVKDLYDIPKTIDYMDALSKGMERRIASEPFFKRIFVKWEYFKLRDYENSIFDYFDHHTIISEQDRQFIFHRNKDQIHIIKNGIDCDFFKARGIDKTHDLVFVGNLSYAPNIKACHQLVKEILPKLIVFKPDITILISGATPAKEVLNLASENVEISGWVDDIRDSYEKAKVFVAPLNIGTGLQNKLLEAMSLNIASITTSLVNNALKAEDGKDLLIADFDDDFVEKIIELLDNEDLRKDIAGNGRSFVHSNFDWKSSTEALISILKRS